MKTFLTRVENLRKTAVSLWEGQQVLAVVQPGQIYLLEALSPFATYARYSEITYTTSTPLVVLKVRPDWVEPDRGPLTIEVVNLSGEALIRRVIGKDVRFLPFGIPMIFTLTPDDDVLTGFKRLEIQRLLEDFKSDEWPGYVTSRYISKDKLIERDVAELKKLLEMRAANGLSNA